MHIIDVDNFTTFSITLRLIRYSDYKKKDKNWAFQIWKKNNWQSIYFKKVTPISFEMRALGYIQFKISEMNTLVFRLFFLVDFNVGFSNPTCPPQSSSGSVPCAACLLSKFPRI